MRTNNYTVYFEIISIIPVNIERNIINDGCGIYAFNRYLCFKLNSVVDNIANEGILYNLWSP